MGNPGSRRQRFDCASGRVFAPGYHPGSYSHRATIALREPRTDDRPLWDVPFGIWGYPGIGRRLMEAIIRRSDERGSPGVRLVQAAYHARSLSLYTKLGFASREELAVMDGTPAGPQLEGYVVRPLAAEDLAACNALCTAVHGFHREREVRGAAAAKAAFVAERAGAIRAYTSGLGYFGHSVAETNDALCALLAFAPRIPSLGVLVPVRNYTLLRWASTTGCASC